MQWRVKMLFVIFSHKKKRQKGTNFLLNIAFVLDFLTQFLMFTLGLFVSPRVKERKLSYYSHYILTGIESSVTASSDVSHLHIVRWRCMIIFAGLRLPVVCTALVKVTLLNSWPGVSITLKLWCTIFLAQAGAVARFASCHDRQKLVFLSQVYIVWWNAPLLHCVPMLLLHQALITLVQPYCITSPLLTPI